MTDGKNKVAAALASGNRQFFERRVRPRITPELVAEHRADPFGLKSSDLEVLLRYLRRDPVKSKPRLVLYAETPYAQYRVAEHTRRRGAPLRVRDDSYGTEEDAQHAIFVERLRQLGDAHVTSVLERAGEA